MIFVSVRIASQRGPEGLNKSGVAIHKPVAQCQNPNGHGEAKDCQSAWAGWLGDRVQVGQSHFDRGFKVIRLQMEVDLLAIEFTPQLVLIINIIRIILVVD